MNNRLILAAALCLPFATDALAQQWNPRPGWKDSYAVDGQCFCDTNGFDHNLDEKSAPTPIGRLNVVRICADIEATLGRGSSEGRIPYNDIQCGNGPANDARDEAGCPGRVDIGPEGCDVIGPKWNLEAVYGSRPGSEGDSPSTPEPTPETGEGSRASASHNSGDAKYAIDGNPNTRWTSRAHQTPGMAFVLDLGEVETIGRVTLDTRGNPNDTPTTYTLSVSRDGKAYEQVASGAGGTDTTVVRFPDERARYVRIVQGGSKRYWWSIHEISVAGGDGSSSTPAGDPTGDTGGGSAPASGPLARSGWTMIASTQASSVPYAIDGRIDSRWTTVQTQRPGQWFEIDLNTTATIDRIVLKTTTKSNERFDYPRGYRVSVSADGADWSTVATGRGDGSTTDLSFGARPARYVRIEQTGSDSRRWWSIGEVNVYR